MGKAKNKGKNSYKIGTVSDVIAKSCGVSKLEFDPKLAAFFSNSSTSTSKSVVRIKQKDEEALPVPKIPKEKIKSLTNKEAADIRLSVNAKNKLSDADALTKNIGARAPGHKKLKKEKVKTNTVKEKTNVSEMKAKVDYVEEVEDMEDAVKEKVSAPIFQEKNSVGEIKKSLHDLNAPKEKNPELESRTIFVGNVPKEANKKKLLKVFKDFGGTIETLRLRCAAPDKPTRLKKVAMNRKELHPDRASIAAYIRYKTREEAEAVVQTAKEKGITMLDHHLVLDLADRSLKRDNKKAIFVGNLHLKTQDDEIWQLFSDCGQVESVRVVRDRETSLGKGFGYVNFIETSSVELALQKDGTEFKNRPLRVSRCVKKEKKTESFNGPVKGKNLFPKARVEALQSSKNTANKPVVRISQGKRQRKEPVEQFSGDRTAEKGKFKRNSKKPNRDDMKKAKIAKQLASTKLSTTDYKTKKKEMRKLNKPRWPRNKK